jgi:hypothetical protein
MEFSTGKHTATLPCFSVWWHMMKALLSVFPPPPIGPIAPPQCGGAHATELWVPHPLVSSSGAVSLLHRRPSIGGCLDKDFRTAALQNGSPAPIASSPWSPHGASMMARRGWPARYWPQCPCHHSQVCARVGPLALKAVGLRAS